MGVLANKGSTGRATYVIQRGARLLTVKGRDIIILQAARPRGVRAVPGVRALSNQCQGRYQHWLHVRLVVRQLTGSNQCAQRGTYRRAACQVTLHLRALGR